ncbi:hypothetical protein AUJ44_01460 [Candidatus Nomurabacteria bacterium CG1_02_47_685]|nr:MAG: hypothetical protein AUJ44_01460 [Candidatus Nomurabacteria bacterium CG1_02_47_685]
MFGKDISLMGAPWGEIERDLLFVGWGEETINRAFRNVRLEASRKQARTIRSFWSVKKAKKVVARAAAASRMRMNDILRFAMRIFKVRPGRTILTILGIGVSFGTIFFLVSLGYGLEHLLLRQISSDESLLTLDVFTNNQDAIPLNSDSLSSIKNVEHIEKAYPVVNPSGQVEIGDLVAEADFYGVSESYFGASGERFVGGESFSDGDKTVVLSSVFARIFNVSNTGELIGKDVYIVLYLSHKNIIEGTEDIQMVSIEEPLRVVGVVDDPAGNRIYVPFSLIANLDIPYATVKVVVDDSSNFGTARAAIINMGFNTRAIVDTIEQADKIFKVFQVILALFGITSLVVAMIGMINTMTIALLERIQEIGIMKILGVSNGDIRRLFLFEASLMGFLGGTSGLIIGFFVSRVFNIGINFLAKTLGGNSVELFYYPVWFVVVIIAFASIVGFATGLAPSHKAATMDSLDALRYK